MIDRPIEEVFAFIHDPRNDASRQTTLIESAQVDDEEPYGVGTQIRERRRFLGMQVEMTKEITEYEPSGPLRSRWSRAARADERALHARTCRAAARS